MKYNQTYTVAVGGWHYDDGTPAPDFTCGHNHRTPQAAEKCGTRLRASVRDLARVVRVEQSRPRRKGGEDRARSVAGQVESERRAWQACATWHNGYVTEVGR